jgi:threonine dehydrogenase-like Zn-dependent dehydrogenase
MKGLTLDANAAPHVVRLAQDLPAPARPAGEALLEVRLAGICDTDLQLAKGYMGYRGVLGHEFVGEVLACDNAGFRGKRVVADINAGCGDCDDCRLRDGHHCERRTVLGIVARSGALAEQVAVPERCLVEVPDSVSDEQAVFAEPLAAALHVGKGTSLGAHSRVAVLGDGKLGLLVVMALASLGAQPILIGRHTDKMRLVAALCRQTLLEPGLSDGDVQPCDVVIECTGNAEGIRRAIALTKPRGTLVLKTTVAGATSVDLSPVVVNEIQIVGSRCGDMRAAVAALAGGLDPTSLIAARYPLAEGERAFAHAATRGTLKVLVDPLAG